MKRLYRLIVAVCSLLVIIISSCDIPESADNCFNADVTEEIQLGELDYHSTIDLSTGQMSDHIIVGNELWAFYVSDDEHQDYSIVLKYSLDLEKRRYKFKGKFLHNFGHCNTVDYCSGNDTIIMGNGGASYEEHPQIYIFEKVDRLVKLNNGEKVNLFDTAKVIDLSESGIDLGQQINVCWGESNRDNCDIIYALSNKDNIKYINRIILGKGKNKLDYGNLISAKEDEFNGTFKILNRYTTDYSYDRCNQGTQYYNGKLYEALGHDSICFSETSFFEGDKIKIRYYKSKYYNAFGEQYARIVPEGIALKDNYMFLGCDDKDSGNKILIYKI